MRACLVVGGSHGAPMVPGPIVETGMPREPAGKGGAQGGRATGRKAPELRRTACRRGGKRVARRVAIAALALLGGVLASASSRAIDPDPAPTVSSYAPVEWQLLADFPYDDPGLGGLDGATAETLAKRRQQLPAAVRALDGKMVSVRGFAVPADIDGGRISEFLLLAKNELGCCFGDSATMNQWILVRVRRGDHVELDDLEPVSVSGRLEVGEEVESGTVLSLYRLTAHRVEPAP